MAIQGLRDTSNFLSSSRPQNWREGLLLNAPNGIAPLTALTSMMKKRKVDDPVFNWFDKEQQTRRLRLGASITATATSITVATTEATATAINPAAGARSCVNGTLLLVENTGEIVQVTADPASDTVLSVQRGMCGTTAYAVTYNASGVNPNLTIIGTALEEGSLPPTGVNYDPNLYTNYTQIFRQTLEITRTAAKTRLRTGDAVKEAKRECLELFSMDLERALWFGKKGSTVKNGKPCRTMAGFEAFIPATNIATANTSSGCTMEALEGYMEAAFKFGSSEKLLFTGNKGLLTINQIVRKNTTWNITSGLKEAGMNVSRLICPFGELIVKTHPLFNRMTGGTDLGSHKSYYGRDSYAYIIDAAELQYVTFQDDDVKYQPDLQANGLDGQQAGYIAECSIEVHNPKAHYLIKNLAKAAKDS